MPVPSSVTELRVTVPVGPHAALPTVRRFLHAAGIPSADLVETVASEVRSLSWYTPRRTVALTLARCLRPYLSRGVTVAARTLRPADWQTRWQRAFKPFSIAPGMRVVPARRRAVVTPRPGDIVIDPGMAFGTGLHPTTRAMAGFIVSCGGACRDFLDIGSGTGILGIVAARAGIRRVQAVDISADAIAATKKNFSLNGCRWRRCDTADLARWSPAGPCDFIAANLLGETLIVHRDRLCAWLRPGGYLAVSGIWHAIAPRVRRAYAAAGFVPVKSDRRDGWVSLLYQRKSGKKKIQ